MAKKKGVGKSPAGSRAAATGKTPGGRAKNPRSGTAGAAGQGRRKAAGRSRKPVKKAPSTRSRKSSKDTPRSAARIPSLRRPPGRAEGRRVVPRPFPEKVEHLTAPAALPPDTVLPEETTAPRLPETYGDNLIYAMVRDPHYIFTYWEIQKDREEETLRRLGGDWARVHSILRVYDVTGGAGQVPYEDIELHGGADRWYLHVQPRHSYLIEIGLRHHDGRFLMMARSNEVSTPRASFSDVLDEEWMGDGKSDEIIKLSAGSPGETGLRAGSSAELGELLQKNLVAAISSGSGSGAISSLMSPVKPGKGKGRGFWFVLDCEVIIYGATEPEAQVTFQGKPVKLRSDGTFSFRFALPDGDFVFDAVAKSSDGMEERTITPRVTRRTERPAPVFRHREEVS